MRSFEVGDYVGDVKIGTGSFAEVWKGTHKVTKQQVAIKVVDLERLSRSNNNNENKLKQHLASEMKIMKSLDHKNIVKMFDFEETKVQIIMILELCEGGDFSKYIKKHKRLSERRAKYFMQQLASGLESLRREGVIHRDLKPQNLLLSDSSDRPVLKIADFGFARYIDTQSMAHTLCGSPLYMAPEILKLHNYTIKADLWSVGIILYEILVGVPPFEAKNIISLMQAVDENKIKFPPNVPISKECMDLIMGLLQKDPTQRISWEEFFLHPWLGMHQPQQPQPTSLPITHSKSQPNLSSATPIRNFLHDDRLLQQSPFNTFLNPPTTIPSTGNPPTHPHLMARCNSTTAIQTYKINSAGVAVSNPNSYTTNTTTNNNNNNGNKNAPDPKKAYRHTINYSVQPTNITGPPSFPNNTLAQNTYRNSMSSSPPRGTPPTPPISPATTSNSKHYPHSSTIPPSPLSSSPPANNYGLTYHKAVSFGSVVDNTNPPYLLSPKDPTDKYPTGSSTRPLYSYSEQKFLAPKANSSNSDSFEKDCVILDNVNTSTGNPSSAELSQEAQVISEIESKYKRAFAVSDLGDLKIEGEMPYEAFAVYIKGVEMFCQALDFARLRAQAHNLTQSPRINDIVKTIKEKAALYLKTVEYWKTILVPTETIPDADRIIYYHALHMGRLAGVDETWKDYPKCEEVYFTAILLLESLLSEEADPNDKDILQTYTTAFSKRLSAVQSKRQAANKA